jgi:hypothetical protein
MSRGRRVWTARCVAVAFVLSGVVLPAHVGRADDEEARALLFSGRDLWRNGVFVYGGFVLAPGGFEQDGFLFKVLVSGGAYRYVAGRLGGARVTGYEGVLQAMPGVRIKRGDAEMKFFFGPEGQRHSLRPDDPGNRLRGRDIGLRMAGELWYEPASAVLVTGDAALSSIQTSHSARLAFGWRVADGIFNGNGFYIGPESQVFGSDGYRHWRLGTHITSMKAESTEWSASTGWARDSDGRAGVYVRLNLSSRR